MKLYEFEDYPNPRRVSIFLAEKGLTVESVQVDLPAGEHHHAWFLRKNPYATIPVLELDDGTCISETVAICRYLEDIQPEPPLMGRTALEKAKIDMWQRRVEQSLMRAVGAYFQHGTEGLGEPDRYRNREWGLENRARALRAIRKLEGPLTGQDYLVDGVFSIADITGLCALEFAEEVGIEIPESCPNVARWFRTVSSRPSAAVG